jgi:hypothetical protein
MSRGGSFKSLLVVVLASLALPADRACAQEVELSAPGVVLKGITFDVTVSDPGGRLAEGATVTLTVGDQRHDATVAAGAATIEGVVTAASEVQLSLADEAGTVVGTATAPAIPAWFSLLPALLAIVIALAFRQVIPALFLGIWLGGTLAYGLYLSSLWHGLLDTAGKYTLAALNDSGHLSVILFSLMIGGMVGIISKNGGTSGIVAGIVSFASSAKRGQLTTGALGVRSSSTTTPTP